MRAPLVLSILLLLLAPTAAAQAPDPEAAVALACGAVGTVSPDARDELPVCPREEPAGPAAPEEAGHGAADAPADPREDPAGAARGLADEGQAAAQGALDDPPSTPGRIAGLVASIRQFVEDLLELPRGAAEAIRVRLDAAVASFDAWRLGVRAAAGDFGAALAEGAARGAAAVSSAADRAWDALGSLVSARAETPREDSAVDGVPVVDARDTGGLLEDLQRAVDVA